VLLGWFYPRKRKVLNSQIKEDIMQESVIYQDILQKGNKQGEERLIIIMLNQRFSEIDTLLIERVRGLSIEQLENLGKALLYFTNVSDLEVWLNQNEAS
jgi:predicted transposase YdaD